MRSPEGELIWQGRVQLGDEPGTFGDASYAGLVTEIPVTLAKVDSGGSDTTTVIVRTNYVQTYAPYPGHLLTATLYQDGGARSLASTHITARDEGETTLELDLVGVPSPVYVGIRIQVDTSVPPGLYDDFIVSALLHKSKRFAFAAQLGFRV